MSAFDPLRTLAGRGTIAHMFLVLAAIMGVAQQGSASTSTSIHGTAWVFSTIAHSEWCPAGNVMLDLRTGTYSLTARASRRVCNDVSLDRPTRRGRLRAGQLATVRAAYLRAVEEGLENADCQPGRRLNKLVISNGGTPVLVLTTGRGTLVAPGQLSCWSDAADALHDELDRAFPAAQER